VISLFLDQHWTVAGNTYRIDSLDGPQAPHWPIVLVPVNRCESFRQWWEGQLEQDRRHCPSTPEDQRKAEAERLWNMPINVDLAWFQRVDVKRVWPQQEKVA
jgi:hypothetical protein